MKKALTLGALAAILIFGVRACFIRDELRTNGHLVAAKVLAIGGIRGGISVTYTYVVAGQAYTRTSALGGRYAVQGDSIYLKYLPQDPKGNVMIYMSRAEVTSL